jgi:hypothetical protein
VLQDYRVEQLQVLLGLRLCPAAPAGRVWGWRGPVSAPRCSKPVQNSICVIRKSMDTFRLQMRQFPI